MGERKILFIACTILLVIGLVASYFFMYDTEFNFYRSEITVNENQITERLYFTPDEDYHTLFRTFVDPIYVNSAEGNSITIEEVKCSDGVPYVYASNGFFGFSSGSPKPDVSNEYTLDNEYGCNFGSEYGFFPGNDYWIESTFTLNAENLFNVNGKNYIKFVAYSSDDHVSLSESNLIINGDAQRDSTYTPDDNVVIYIPYENVEGKSIITLNHFDYDHSYWKYIISFILALIPALALYICWRLFGKENMEPDIPEELSNYPSKRKGWEVAAYFNPPFNQIDKNFLSSLMLDLYNRKIIDIKTEKKMFSERCYLKVLTPNSTLDSVEKNFIETIKFLASDQKYVKEGYVDIKEAASSGSFKSQVQKRYKDLKSIVEQKGKNYLSSTKGILIYGMIMFALFCIGSSFSAFGILISSFSGLMIVIILSSTSSLLTKYKDNYYEEYKRWQGFKKYLSHAPSLKMHKSAGVVLWGEYLVYAAAFGIAEKVIKELKAQGLISDKQAMAYITTAHASTSFAAATGYSSSGHGGAGGGGVGGGGGGGR